MQEGYFATADEGDMLGGSRGFTIFDSGEINETDLQDANILNV
jgi:hypothetical protein